MLQHSHVCSACGRSDSSCQRHTVTPGRDRANESQIKKHLERSLPALHQQASPFLLRIKLVTLYHVISVGVSHRSREFIV